MVHVSCVQMRPAMGRAEDNLAAMEGFVHSIIEARPETDLVVFPELIVNGYECPPEQFREMAETAPQGKSMKAMGALCKKYGVYVIYGFAEKDPRSETLYNSAALIDRAGQVAGIYRKTHPFDTEKQWCKPGGELPVFQTDFGTLGIMICWDTAFPEVARVFALKGAELLVVCTNWESPYFDDWKLATKARAFDNVLPLVAANRVGRDKNLSFFGGSRVLDPLGKEIAALDEEVEGIIYGALDLQQSQRLRQDYYTYFQDRQPRLYEEITKE